MPPTATPAALETALAGATGELATTKKLWNERTASLADLQAVNERLGDLAKVARLDENFAKTDHTKTTIRAHRMAAWRFLSDTKSYGDKEAEDEYITAHGIVTESIPETLGQNETRSLEDICRVLGLEEVNQNTWTLEEVFAAATRMREQIEQQKEHAKLNPIKIEPETESREDLARRVHDRELEIMSHLGQIEEDRSTIEAHTGSIRDLTNRLTATEQELSQRVNDVDMLTEEKEKATSQLQAVFRRFKSAMFADPASPDASLGSDEFNAWVSDDYEEDSAVEVYFDTRTIQTDDIFAWKLSAMEPAEAHRFDPLTFSQLATHIAVMLPVHVCLPDLLTAGEVMIEKMDSCKLVDLRALIHALERHWTSDRYQVDEQRSYLEVRILEVILRGAHHNNRQVSGLHDLIRQWRGKHPIGVKQFRDGLLMNSFAQWLDGVMQMQSSSIPARRLTLPDVMMMRSGDPYIDNEIRSYGYRWIRQTAEDSGERTVFANSLFLEPGAPRRYAVVDHDNQYVFIFGATPDTLYNIGTRTITFPSFIDRTGVFAIPRPFIFTMPNFMFAAENMSDVFDAGVPSSFSS